MEAPNKIDHSHSDANSQQFETSVSVTVKQSQVLPPAIRSVNLSRHDPLPIPPPPAPLLSPRLITSVSSQNRQKTKIMASPVVGMPHSTLFGLGPAAYPSELKSLIIATPDKPMIHQMDGHAQDHGYHKNVPLKEAVLSQSGHSPNFAGESDPKTKNADGKDGANLITKNEALPKNGANNIKRSKIEDNNKLTSSKPSSPRVRIQKWKIYSMEDQRLNSPLGEVSEGDSFYIGRTHSSTRLDLKIQAVRVSRKQLFLKVLADGISCRNDGINAVNVYMKKVGSFHEKRQIYVATKIRAEESFMWRENESIEFNTSFNEDEPIKFLLVRTQDKPDFDIVFENPEAKQTFLFGKMLDKGGEVRELTPQPSPIHKVKGAKEKKDSKSAFTTPDKPSNSLMKLLDPDETDREDARASIIERLGEKFSFKRALTDLDVINQSSARIGPQYQALIPTFQEQTAETIKSSTKPLLIQFDAEVDPNLSASARFSGTYLKGLLAYNEFNSRNWSEEESKLFEESIRTHGKNFSKIAQDLTTNSNSSFSTKDCVDYYYRFFKANPNYKEIKQSYSDNHKYYIVPGVDDGDSSSVDIKARGKNDKSKRKGKKSDELMKLMEGGLLTAGSDVLYLNYFGKRVAASLTDAGMITFKGEQFDSASSWSYHVKRQLNPKLRSDNGWSSVHYEGKPLSYYRDVYDPAMKTTLKKASAFSSEDYVSPFIKDHDLKLDCSDHDKDDDNNPLNEDRSVPTLESIVSSLMQDGIILPSPGRIPNLKMGVQTGVLKQGTSDSIVIDILTDDGESHTFSSFVDWNVLQFGDDILEKSIAQQSDELVHLIHVLVYKDDAVNPVVGAPTEMRRLDTLLHLWKHADKHNLHPHKHPAGGLSLKRKRTSLNIQGEETEKGLLPTSSKKRTLARVGSENWSKYDRYCICRKKYIETSLDDWYIQCSKGTSYCNGWVHPSCFGLNITHEQGENIENFVCPLCSLDTLEFSFVLEKDGDTLILIPVDDSAVRKNEPVFLDFEKKNLFQSALLASKDDLEKLQSLTSGMTTVRRRKVQYLAGTQIRSLRKLHEIRAWIPGVIIGLAKENPVTSEDLFVYIVEYKDIGREIINLENNPEHMLASDWERSEGSHLKIQTVNGIE